MYYLSYEVAPKSTHPNFDELGGAFANFWINLASPDRARQAAERILASLHWDIVAVEDEELVELGRFEYSQTALERIAQAEIDGEVCELHTWPRDEAQPDAS